MTQRLVYSPKAFVFIKDSNKVVHDVSRYVVSGNVTRKINQVSTAEISLRNPNKFFTDPHSQTGVSFRPQDPITIFLQRLQDRPVRVFTGYLDKTPYYQMYPGNISIRASCTLKRLQYTFFDPALPYTLSFLSQYHWVNQNGNIINLDAQALGTPDPAGHTKLSDGSIGELLWATLFHIAKWPDKNIYIEPLPKDLVSRMTILYNALAADNEIVKAEIEQLLSTIIGQASYGSGGVAGPSGSGSGATGQIRGANKIIPVLVKNAHAAGIDPLFVITTAMAETGGSLDPGVLEKGGGAGTKQGDLGLFQQRTDGTTPYSNPSTPGWSAADATDPGKASWLFARAAAALAPPGSSLRQEANWEQWATQTQGSVGYPTWNVQLIASKALLSQYGNAAPGASQGATSSGPAGSTGTGATGAPTSSQRGSTNSSGKSIQTSAGQWVFPIPKGKFVGQGSWTQDQGVDIANTPPSPTPDLLAVADGTVVGHGISGFGPDAPILQIGSNTYVYYGHAGPRGAVPIGTKVRAGQVIGSIGEGIVGLSSGPHLEFGFCDRNGAPRPGTSGQAFSQLQSALVIDTGQAIPSGVGAGGNTGAAGTGGAGGSGGAPTMDAVMAASSASAFAAQVQFPSLLQSVEAVALQGNKSLLNDVPLLPFIQQLTQASMRSFQSLPNGDFFAFYPDYFGEVQHHIPYWLIDDLEVLDGGIDLTDDNLATHVYVVGDTTRTGNDMLNALFSAGSINIFNAFGGGVVTTKNSQHPVTSQGLDHLMNKEEATKFLQRYGARPVTEQMPMVRSPWYEMFLAYQMFMLAWSRQFVTPFTMTFMPELYPGGKVGFPNHGLQMYIEEVTHTWDYTTGFLTQAQLSAPAVMTTDGSGNNIAQRITDQLPPNMVQALADPVITKASTGK